MNKQRAAIETFKEQLIEEGEVGEKAEAAEAFGGEGMAEVMPGEAPLDLEAASFQAAPSIPPQAKQVPSPPKRRKRVLLSGGGQKTSEELQLEREALEVRETGFFRWKTVIVPPNAYVVHTRLGKPEPITLGLGRSFKFNPYTDSYLVVPAAMQTIGIVATCISKEKQGIHVLAYVQWLISDFSVAYRHLDFSDPRAPMGIVNAQLREQAEAAIKDKVATMSVEEVLTDKAPIIAELTARMKAVAEGRRQEGEAGEGEGLGLRIVTVQIKEAFVSSQSLWENLQAPFRHQQEQKARLSRLAVEEKIRTIEREQRLEDAAREAETAARIEQIQAERETEAFDIVVREKHRRLVRKKEEEQKEIKLLEETELLRRESNRRLREDARKDEVAAQIAQLEGETSIALERMEQETIRKTAQAAERAKQEAAEHQAALDALAREGERAIEHAQIAARRIAAERETALAEQAARLERERIEGEAELALQKERLTLENAQTERELAFARMRQEIENNVTERGLTKRAIEILPELVERMPKIDSLESIQVTPVGADATGTSQVHAFLVELFALLRSLRGHAPSPGDRPDDTVESSPA